MQAVAAWCVRHRRLVVAGWLLVLILVTGLARTAGSSFSNVFSLPGTGSAEAAALLTAVSPKVSGDTEQVVVATSGRTLITDPAVRSRVDAMLARVADVAHVTQVVSPYRPSGAAQVSRGRHVAYATVTFDRPSWDIPMSTASHLLHAVASGNGDGVSAAVGGAVAKQAESPSLSSTGIGIIAASVVLALVFGSLFATALPLVSALVSLGTASGVLALLSHAMSISTDATTLMALISLGVGVDYALFIVTRHRQGLLAVAEVEQSIVTSVNSSGRAVLVAGTIVCVALLGMLALGVNFLSGVAVATAVGVALTMAASLTLLPALLGFIGPRVLSRRQRARLAAAGPRAIPGSGQTFWARWATFIARRPVLPAVAALGVIAIIAVPFLSLRLGSSDQGSDPVGSSTRQAYDMLARGFGPGFNGPMELAAAVRDPAQRAALGRVVAAVRQQAGVAGVLPPQLIPARGGGQVALITAYPATSPQDAATTTLLHHLRDATIPAAVGSSGLHVYIGGTTAIFADFAQLLSAKLPLFIGTIVALSFLVLAVVFRSVVIPLIAAVMNLLSISAAFGMLVAVFQWGWLGPVLGVTRAGPIESILPVALFAIVFGISMDYQVFLLSRVHEEWNRTGDNARAVRHGVAVTGRTITSAALIMIVVFGSFMVGTNREIKEFGLGLAGGVLIDAVVVRSALVPSLMLLLGRINWWFPRWLDRAVLRVHIDASPGQGPGVVRSSDRPQRAQR